MITEKPRVLVLLAAFNGSAWISDQLSSILGQHNVEVLVKVSVDRSSDNTLELLEFFQRNDPRVRILPDAGTFGGAARNFFRLMRDVELSGFDYVAFADQDDIWFPDKLWRACSLIKKGVCDVYSSNVIAFWVNGRYSLVDKSQSPRGFDHFFEAAGPGCTYVFSRLSYLQFQRFVMGEWHRIGEVVLHDWLAYAFCRERGFVWFIDPRPSMLYRQHSGNQVGINMGLGALWRRFKWMRSNWYRDQVNLIASLIAPEKAFYLRRRSFLIFRSFQLRRRLRDRVLLVISIIFGIY